MNRPFCVENNDEHGFHSGFAHSSRFWTSCQIMSFAVMFSERIQISNFRFPWWRYRKLRGIFQHVIGLRKHAYVKLPLFFDVRQDLRDEFSANLCKFRLRPCTQSDGLNSAFHAHVVASVVDVNVCSVRSMSSTLSRPILNYSCYFKIAVYDILSILEHLANHAQCIHIRFPKSDEKFDDLSLFNRLLHFTFVPSRSTRVH